MTRTACRWIFFLSVSIVHAAEEMDQADEELRETIRHIWPLQARKILELLIPKSDCGWFFFFFFAYSGAALVGFYSFYKFKKHFLAIRTGLNAGKLTVGKIYAGLLILESWKSTKFGQVEPTNPQVIYYCVFVYKIILMKKLYKK